MFLTIFLCSCIFVRDPSRVQDEFNVDDDGDQQKQHSGGLRAETCRLLFDMRLTFGPPPPPRTRTRTGVFPTDLAEAPDRPLVGQFVFPGEVQAPLLSRDEGLGSRVGGPGLHPPDTELSRPSACPPPPAGGGRDMHSSADTGTRGDRHIAG